jgi:hypothetical protein
MANKGIKKAPMKTLNKEEIRKAFYGKNSIPDSFFPDKLEPVAMARFKGDNFTGQLANWSVNDKFDKGVYYPIYPDADNTMLLALGKDGIAYKMTPAAWGKCYQVEH